MLHPGFVFLDEAAPGVRWDAKYAGSDNFVGEPVDGYRVNRVVGTRELGQALCVARDLAAEQGLDLLLWDAYRPQRAVDHFLRWCAQEEDGRTRQAHYPRINRADLPIKGYIAARSGHSRGSTVDLTLTDRAGHPLDMGGGFDLMDEVSHHDSPLISPEQTRNRECLRAIMKQAGFLEYSGEWWHYRLKDEPYPDTWFDFPIE